MSWNGAPPTVIRDLDELFARRQARRARDEPGPTTNRPPTPASNPALLAHALLAKVATDFAPAPGRPDGPSPAPSTPVPAAPPVANDPPPPSAARPTPAAPLRTTLESTAELGLPDDDEDVARLVPWHRKLIERLFGR